MRKPVDKKYRDWQPNPVRQKIGSPTRIRPAAMALIRSKQGETDMGDKGKKDKGRREKQQKARLSPKEKRKAKREKKIKGTTQVGGIV